MLRRIVKSSLHFRFLVVAAAAVMMFLGTKQLFGMPVDVFPEFAPPYVEIQTEGPGMSTQEVESLITVPLENSLNSTPHLDILRSKSVPGVSAITLIFKSGTDIMQARQLVQERLAIAIRTLPSWAAAPVGDESGRADRDFLEHLFPDRSGHDHVLVDPVALDGGPRRGECRHLGRPV